MDEQKQLQYDIDGYDAMGLAILDLLNTYPDLDETVLFAVLGEDGGISMFPTSGAIIRSNSESVTGHVTQKCVYPFYLCVRTGSLNESRKINMQNYLDVIGRWLEKQPIQVEGNMFVLSDYPAMQDGRVIERISRISPAYQLQANADNTEDWVINLQAEYTFEFDR